MREEACLLFLDPNNLQKKVYGLLYPNHYFASAIKEFLRENSIEDFESVENTEITSQDAKEYVAAEIKIFSDTSQNPPIVIFCEKSNIDLLRSLFKKSGDIRAMNGLRFSGYLIREERCKSLRKLLAYIPNIPFLDSQGSTLLHFAAENGKEDLVDALLEFGADVNRRRTDGSTALHLAARRNYFRQEIVKKLLAKGGDVNAVTNNGNTPLECAFQCEPDHRTIQLLIENGADLNASWPAGDGSEALLSTIVKQGDLELLKLLFEAKVDGWTNPKLLAVATRWHACLKITKFLIESGWDPNYIIDEKGRSCMSFNSSKDCLDCLLQFGACCKYSDVHHLTNFKEQRLRLTGLFDIFNVFGKFLQAFLDYCPVHISDADLQTIVTGDEVKKEVKRHVVKLEVLSRKSRVLYSEAQVDEELSEFRKKCQEEAKKLDENIKDTQLTYRDILTSERAIRYVKNRSVVDAMKEEGLKESFPIFCSMLLAKFQSTVLRKTLGDEVIPIMRVLLSQFSPTNKPDQPALADELIEMITSYLSVRDLVVLQKFVLPRRKSTTPIRYDSI